MTVKDLLKCDKIKIYPSITEDHATYGFIYGIKIVQIYKYTLKGIYYESAVYDPINVKHCCIKTI